MIGREPMSDRPFIVSMWTDPSGSREYVLGRFADAAAPLYYISVVFQGAVQREEILAPREALELLSERPVAYAVDDDKVVELLLRDAIILSLVDAMRKWARPYPDHGGERIMRSETWRGNQPTTDVISLLCGSGGDLLGRLQWFGDVPIVVSSLVGSLFSFDAESALRQIANIAASKGCELIAVSGGRDISNTKFATLREVWR